MLRNIKKELRGKGLLEELEACRNEEEAIALLKREKLWGGVVNYPELEELKESYKNGEIEADKTLSLNQLDKVAGGEGNRARRQTRRKTNPRMSENANNANKEKFPGYLEGEGWENSGLIELFKREETEGIFDQERNEAGQEEVNTDVEKRASVENNYAFVNEQNVEKKQVFVKEEEVEAKEDDAEGIVVEEMKKEVTEDKEGKENLGELVEQTEENPVDTKEGMKDEEEAPVEEPVKENVDKAPVEEGKLENEQEQEKAPAKEPPVEQAEEKSEDISEEVQGPKTLEDTIKEKIKEGKEVKLELTSLGKELIFANKSYEDIIEAAKESEERIKVKEMHDKLMKEASQVPFPFEMKNEEDYGDVPDDIFEDISAHRGKNTEPFLNELRDVWQNKEELREEIQRRIEKIGELRSKGNFTVAEKETDALRLLVLENSIVESAATADEEVFSSVMMPFAVASPDLSEDDAVKTLKIFQPNTDWGPWVKYIYNIDNPFVNSILKLFIYKLKNVTRNNPYTSRAINMFIKTLNSYKKDKKNIDALIPTSIEFDLFNTGATECDIELKNKQIIVAKKSTRSREYFKNMIKRSVALFPEKSQKILIEKIIPEYTFETISCSSTKLSTMEGGLNRSSEKKITIKDNLQVTELAHELAHSIFNYFLENDPVASKKVKTFLFLITTEAGKIKKETFRLLVGLPSYLGAPVLAGLFDLMCKIVGRDLCKETFDVSINELYFANISGTVKSVERYRGDLIQEGFAYMAQAHFEANMSEEGKLRYMLYQTIFPETMKFVRDVLATP